MVKLDTAATCRKLGPHALDPSVHLLRLPKPKRKNNKEDLKLVLDQANATMAWIKSIRFIVPEEQWSAKLHR